MKKLKLYFFTIFALGLLCLTYLPAEKVYAKKDCGDHNTKCPYFKTFGGDVFSGGWYVEDGSCKLDSKYQDPDYSPKNPLNGGLMAYADWSGQKPDGGTSSEYAALSLGDIPGDNDKPLGFYSDGATAGQPVYQLTFAYNSGFPRSWGGIFQGNVRQAHCIPNYYAKLPNPKPDPPLAEGPLIDSSGFYYAHPPSGNFDLDGGSVGAGHNITIFVDGSVYISQNITYAASDADHVPKFALVVKGSIYVGPNVTRLDGLYIAQPDPSELPDGRNGAFWTCHPGDKEDQNIPKGNELARDCDKQLVVNGAIIAKQINFTRIQGNIKNASTDEDKNDSGKCAGAIKLGNAGPCGNIAEIINYSPTMVIGGPFFSPTPNSVKLNVQSLISLPPAL